MQVFGVENRDTLTHKATGVIRNPIFITLWAFCPFYYPTYCLVFEQYSAKLLKKPDQCRAVYACSHLFWVDDQDNMKDGERCDYRAFSFSFQQVLVMLMPVALNFQSLQCMFLHFPCHQKINSLNLLCSYFKCVDFKKMVLGNYFGFRIFWGFEVLFIVSLLYRCLMCYIQTSIQGADLPKESFKDCKCCPAAGQCNTW